MLSKNSQKLPSTPSVYETIGSNYRSQRIPDPRIEARIVAALGNARTVCNIGAGTGSYEPRDREVTAVEPSRTMIEQRESRSPVVRAIAENLPFADRAFDAAMALLTVHHWVDPNQGLAEMRRVSARQVIFTFDPKLSDRFWLVADYLPEIAELENNRSLTIDDLVDSLAPARVETVPVPWDCSDGFQAAYWRRPKEYLKPDVQASISTLAQMSSRILSRAMRQLAADLKSGEWERRYGHLSEIDEFDFGYRLIVAESPS